MQRILIASTKGGCGKTTLTTNLAVAYARIGRRVVIVDCDQQASSIEWAKARGTSAPVIPVIPSADNGQGITTVWSLKIPPGTQIALIDTPAGLRRNQIAELTRRCDTIVVPVVPSAIDLRATMPFLAELKQIQAIRSGQVRVALVANRMRERTVAARELRALGEELPFPLITVVRDTQAYVLAATVGKGVFDFATAATQECRDDWQPLLHWLEPPGASAQPQLQLGAETPPPAAILAGGSG